MNDELIESGIPWIGSYPNRWKLTKLRNVAVFNPSKGTIKDDELVSIVPMECVSEKGELKIDRLETFSEVDKGLNCFKKGDVLFAKITPCMENGKGGLVAELPTTNAFGSTEFFVFRPNEKVDGKYLYYSTYNTPFRKLAEINMKGAAGQQRVPSKFLVTTKFPLPPKSEQEVIARHLDKITAQIDDAIAIKQQQVAKLEDYFNEQVREVMKTGIDGNSETTDSGVEHLGKVPAHWKVVQLKHAVDFLNHKRIPLSSAERGEMVEKVYDYYGASGVIDQVEDFIFDEPLLLIAEDGANLLSRSSTLAFIASGQYWVNNHAHIIKPRAGDLRFWAYMLESYDYTIYVTGAAQPKLNLTNLGKMKVAIPKPTEQIAIADYLSSLQDQQDLLRETVNKQITTLQAYRRSVIHEYVTGKKRVAAY